MDVKSGAGGNGFLGTYDARRLGAERHELTIRARVGSTVAVSVPEGESFFRYGKHKIVVDYVSGAEHFSPKGVPLISKQPHAKPRSDWGNSPAAAFPSEVPYSPIHWSSSG